MTEAGCAIHGAAELGLAGDCIAALAGFGCGDESGIQVGVDGHLLSGHGIEGEAGCYLSGADSAVADDEILNGN